MFREFSEELYCLRWNNIPSHFPRNEFGDDEGTDDPEKTSLELLGDILDKDIVIVFVRVNVSGEATSGDHIQGQTPVKLLQINLIAFTCDLLHMFRSYAFTHSFKGPIKIFILPEENVGVTMLRTRFHFSSLMRLKKLTKTSS